MPKKGGTLTPQERAFIEDYSKHGNAQLAARNAGFAQPRSAGYKALQRPAINAEITRQQAARLNNELLPLAIQAIERLLVDKKTPAGAVVQAAKLVMDRTLGPQDGPENKAPHEMTGEELARQLDRLRSEAAARAKPVIEGESVEIAQSAPSVLD